MKILWHSTSPESHSGYGVVTRELVRRLREAGHFVRIATKHAYAHWGCWIDRQRIREHLSEARLRFASSERKLAIEHLEAAQAELDGVEIFEGTNAAIVNEMVEAEGFDYVFTLWDIWLLHGKRHYPREKWIAYIPVDTEWISDTLKEVCLGQDPKADADGGTKGPGWHIAMSRHGERELRSIGLDPYYAPHGVDPNVFKPDEGGRKRFQEEHGLKGDEFVIGAVGLNYGEDRKGFIPLMRAFKRFHERHPEARLYLHTHIEGKYSGTLPYLRIAQKLGITEWLRAPHQGSNDIGRIDEGWLNDCYNGMDVFCLPTRGEGFGIPLVEAGAAGIPIITTDTTTGPELVNDKGWLIRTDQDQLRYLPNNTFRYEVGEGPVLECLESAWQSWKYGNWLKVKKMAQENASRYSWDTVWETYWKPFFEAMEERLK